VKTPWKLTKHAISCLSFVAFVYQLTSD